MTTTPVTTLDPDGLLPVTNLPLGSITAQAEYLTTRHPGELTVAEFHALPERYERKIARAQGGKLLDGNVVIEAVACPACKSPKGDSCRTVRMTNGAAKGVPVTVHHRRVKAARALLLSGGK